MAWARDAAATLSANAAPSSPWNAGNLGATPASGERIIAVIDLNNAVSPSVTGISDDAGNAWTKDGAITSGSFDTLEVWSAVSNGSAPTNIKVAFTPTPVGGAAVSIGAYSGLSTATGAGAALDVFKFAASATSPGDSGTTAGTTTAANELKIGVFSDNGENKTLTAGTIDTTYSLFVKMDANGNAECALEDADSGASGSTARAEVTMSAGGANNAGVLVYKLAAGGAAAFPFAPRTQTVWRM